MNHSKSTSLFHAVTSCRCPRCRKGSMFPVSYLLSFNSLFNMHKECPVCKQGYEPEPGFYWGAMYISYGINVAYAIVVVLFMFLFFRPENIWNYAYITGAIIFLLFPYTFRISRSICLHLMGDIPFNPKIVAEKK